MAKYHVNPKTGEVGKCNSKQGKCPFGGDGIHRDSIVDAQQLADEINIAHAYTITGNFKTGEKFNDMFKTLTCGNCDEEDQVRMMSRGLAELGMEESDVEITHITKYGPDDYATVTYGVDYIGDDGDARNLEIYKERDSKRWFCEHPDYERFYNRVSKEEGFASDMFQSPFEDEPAPAASKPAKLTAADIDTMTFEDGDDFNSKFNELKSQSMSETDEAKLIARGINSLVYGENIKITEVEKLPADRYYKSTYCMQIDDGSGDYRSIELGKTYDGKWFNEGPSYESFYKKIYLSEGFDESLFEEPDEF